MALFQNTLYVTTAGTVLRKENEAVKVEYEGTTKLSIPFHHLHSIVIFGNIYLSPQLMNACSEREISVTFLTEYGRLLSRVDAPMSGNVLLRREQFRIADCEERSTVFAKHFILGKIQNSRVSLMRSSRESTENESQIALDSVANDFNNILFNLSNARSLDVARGKEGEAARKYFSVFNLLLKQQREDFIFTVRSRRPPLDRINCLLSFCYSLLSNDCIAALTAAGLDPAVGFLHVDRPGRPGLALDLMEEFRPLIADRLVISMINRKQITKDDFIVREGGAVEMTDSGRKEVITSYQKRKQEKIQHPFLDQECWFGLLPVLQARILARCIRGELSVYPPCVLK